MTVTPVTAAGWRHSTSNIARHSACARDCSVFEFHDRGPFLKVFPVTGIELIHQMCNKGFHRHLHNDAQMKSATRASPKADPRGALRTKD